MEVTPGRGMPLALLVTGDRVEGLVLSYPRIFRRTELMAGSTNHASSESSGSSSYTIRK